MVDTNIRVVEGFKVFSFNGKGSDVAVVLKGAKDDLSAGDGDIGDILKSLEIHSTAGESAPISMTLLHSHDGTETYSQSFIVRNITVKQDDLNIKLSLVDSDEGIDSQDVVKSLYIHSNDDKEVELTLARV